MPKVLMTDPECCDGSDEWQSGACPNSCAEIGREHRARIEAETKTRKTVSYTSFTSLKRKLIIGSKDQRDICEMGIRGEETYRG